MTMAKIMYLMQRGFSLTQAVDYTIVTDHSIPADAWADARSVTNRAIEKNVGAVAEEVDDEVEQAVISE